MAGHKRKFEDAAGENGAARISFKHDAYMGPHPGKEAAQPRVYEQPMLDYSNQHKGTDFTSWTADQIKAFLDQRGGDYDDYHSFYALVERAAETEANTGPAGRPGQPGEAAAIEDVIKAEAPQAEEEEYDPLEAFMAEINQEVESNKPTHTKQRPELEEEADPAAEYMETQARRQANDAADVTAAVAARGYDSDEEVYATAKALQTRQEQEYDADDNPVVERKRDVDSLEAADHSSIDYSPFAKDFYEEAKEITAMTDQQVKQYRKQLEVRVAGFDVPRPIQEFSQCGFDAQLMGAIKKAGYEKPTAIQAQALPAALSGRDVLGVAKTGSGKTAAFVLPMLVHIMDQEEVDKGQGPIGVILAPTRELAEQIHKEARKFSKPYGLRVVAAFGGLSKYEQVKELRAGSEVAVATPGRLIDLIRAKACTLLRTTYLVLDEADRMFDMGFEPQVRSVLGQIRPDRQTLLFSATMPHKIERLVADALTNPVRVTVGTSGIANEDVIQHVEILPSDGHKLVWLRNRLQGFVDEGEVVVFVGQRARVEELVAALTADGIKAAGIHGDMDQFTRMAVLDGFRSGTHHVLVATDVAARGLDIKTLKTVINYDAARDIDTHIHRVGRTGRAGDKEGAAYSLLLEGRDARFAGQLVQSLTLGGQEVPKLLYELAMKDAHFRKGSSRNKGGGQGGRRGKPQPGGLGLGFGGHTAAPANSAAAAAATGGGGVSTGGKFAGAFGGHRGGIGGAGIGSTGGSNAGGLDASAGSIPTGTAKGNGFVELPGFARSSQAYEEEPSAAAASGAGSAAAGAPAAVNFPPPPPMPSTTAPSSAAPMPAAPSPSAAAAPAPQAAAAPAPQAAQAPPAAPQAAPAPQPQQRSVQAAPAPAPAPAPLTATPAPAADPTNITEAREQYAQARYGGGFKRAFVSSGTTGGDVHQAPTIMLPKVQKARAAVPPPPIPVTARPMYLNNAPTANANRGSGSAPRSFAPAQPSAASQAAAQAAMQSAAGQAAIAAAQAIAARLAAQAPGAVQLPGMQPPPQQQQPTAPQPYQQQSSYQQQQQQQQHAPWQPTSASTSSSAAPDVSSAVAAAQAYAAQLGAKMGSQGSYGGAGAHAVPPPPQLQAPYGQPQYSQPNPPLPPQQQQQYQPYQQPYQQQYQQSHQQTGFPPPPQQEQQQQQQAAAPGGPTSAAASAAIAAAQAIAARLAAQAPGGGTSGSGAAPPPWH